MLRSHIIAVILACSAPFVVGPDLAEAQTGEQVDASPKGLIGLGLIGAELGLVVPAAASLDDTWALITFPLVGAAGGAIAGHFAIDRNDQEQLGVAVLVGGLVLVVPAIVLTLSLRAYDPDDDEGVNDAPTLGNDAGIDEEDGVVSEPPTEVETETAERARAARVARAGNGLLRVGETGWMMGVPAVSLVPTYSVQELSLFGGRQSNELRLALFSGAF